jgi:predicted metal-dependent phosphoesterase TrpH
MSVVSVIVSYIKKKVEKMINVYAETDLDFCEICDHYTFHVDVEGDLECEVCLLSYE